MRFGRLTDRVKVAISLVLIAGSLTGLGVLGGVAAPQYTVSQKGREFHPNTLTIARGETIVPQRRLAVQEERPGDVPGPGGVARE